MRTEVIRFWGGALVMALCALVWPASIHAAEDDPFAVLKFSMGKIVYPENGGDERQYRIDLTPSDDPAYDRTHGDVRTTLWTLTVHCIQGCKGAKDYSERFENYPYYPRSLFSMRDGDDEFIITGEVGAGSEFVKIYKLEPNGPRLVMDTGSRSWPQFLFDGEGKLVVALDPHTPGEEPPIVYDFWRYGGDAYKVFYSGKHLDVPGASPNSAADAAYAPQPTSTDMHVAYPHGDRALNMRDFHIEVRPSQEGPGEWTVAVQCLKNCKAASSFQDDIGKATPVALFVPRAGGDKLVVIERVANSLMPNEVRVYALQEDATRDVMDEVSSDPIRFAADKNGELVVITDHPISTRAADLHTMIYEAWRFNGFVYEDYLSGKTPDLPIE